MAPASLDLSLDEVIQASKGDKGSGKGKGGKRDAPAKEEEPVSLDMSLDELIEKDYLPPKGKGKGNAAWRDDDWVPKKSGWESQSWTEKSKASTGGGGGVAAWKGWKESSGGAGAGWKDNKRNDTWGNDTSWKAATPVAWKPKAEMTPWSSSTEKWGASTKKDWSSGNNKSWDDDWKPKPRGDDWSSKATWTRESGKGSWDRDSWNPTPWSKPAAWDTPRQAPWRPTNEQEREERWNRADRWERREDPVRDRGYGSRRDSGYGGESYDVRDRRGRNERSRTPPRRNYFEDVPRGNVIMVKNIPLGLDSRDIRDAFQSATGTVTSCKMGPDGTARISFERPEDAKKAVATFDNGELNGRIIRVTITG